MRSHSGLRSFRHTFMVCLALVAILFAAGTPVLHAAAHHAHESEHPAEIVSAQRIDHGHGEIHAPSLHDEGRVVQKFAPDFHFYAPAPFGVLVLPAAKPPVVIRSVPRLPSRAPPPGDPARAPPLG
jgi:hypothetical protein